jgi:ring-1,2-phenylacetyl-CoA epoxidase subunit PaaE
MSQFHKLKIKDLKKETKDAVSISFDIPQNLTDEFSFIAGQYITIKSTLNNEELRRAYSICSSPNSGDIRVAIKAVKNGTFSVFATSQLQIGNEIEISKPEGKFVLKTDESNSKNYLAFAAGSGITPVMSMIKSVLETEKNSRFVLVYGNKNTFETIFFDEINTLQSKYNDRFSVQFVYSKEQPEGALFGRIDQSTVNYILNQHADLKFNDVFLCGPEQMINTVVETLESKDFDKAHIHFELFKSSKSKEKQTTSLEGNTSITILLDDEETTFSMSKKMDILEAALKEKLDAPFSCKGGICSSCLAKVTKGKATMTKNTILTDEEVAEGLILTCQAHPTTSEITIDFDDV